MSANGSHGHWSTRQKKHDIDRDTAWASAKHAGWRYETGKVRLTITLVYTRKYRVDADNLAARCKGVIDGLKGWFVDDDTEHLELAVRTGIGGEKATQICLESVK